MLDNVPYVNKSVLFGWGRASRSSRGIWRRRRTPRVAVGDFDIGNARHHGTPEERRAALLVGYETGEPARCNQVVPQT